MKKSMKILLTTGMALIVLFTVFCDENENGDDNGKEKIKIGAIFPLTLEAAQASSQSRVNAIKLAAEEINSAGGIFGKEIEILVEDNLFDSATTVNKANELIQQGCVAIIGPSSSSTTIWMAKYATIPGGIIQITPSGTSPQITGINDNNLLWRTAPSDAFQGKVAADYAYNTLNKQTAGIINVDDAYGNGLANEFKTYFESLGGFVINHVPYPAANDYSDYSFADDVNALFSQNPELIYLVTQSEDGTKITTTIGNEIDLSYHPQFLGCDGNRNVDFLPPNSPDEVVDGMIGFQPAAINDPNRQTYLQNYNNRYGENPASAYAANAYDALYLIAYAMIQADSEIPAEIAAQLITVSSDGTVVGVNDFENGTSLIEQGTDIDYNGASGKLTLDQNGDVATGSYVVWKIENNDYSNIGTVTFP